MLIHLSTLLAAYQAAHRYHGRRIPVPPLLITVSTLLYAGRRLSKKIRKACEVARGYGYKYIWIDSSCINKESSAELSEAINSMYKWYGRADVCLVFLSDVPDDDDVSAPDSAFRRS